MSQESATWPFPSCSVSGRFRQILTHPCTESSQMQTMFDPEAYVFRWKLYVSANTVENGL